jgi:carnitine 3-dehydrogenase
MREIKWVACVGVGLIGQGWATVFSAKGCTVVLQDLTQGVLDNALKRIEQNLEFLEAHHLLKKGEAAEAKGRIQSTTRLDKAVEQVDYVQESAPDRYEIKRPLFDAMDRAATADAILASSSSGLLMTEIQKGTDRPERCVMAHPMLPVHLLPTVEVVGGEKTSPDTAVAVCEFLKKMGKAPVLLKKEVSGYIVNRLQAALLREAIDLVNKGVASAEDVDKAFCMGIGLRDPVIGPLMRAHLAGDGIGRFLEHYAESYRLRWESMECWTKLSASRVNTVVKSVNDMEMVRSQGLEEIKAWRDEMLVKILQVVKT